MIYLNLCLSYFYNFDSDMENAESNWLQIMNFLLRKLDFISQMIKD